MITVLPASVILLNAVSALPAISVLYLVVSTLLSNAAFTVAPVTRLAFVAASSMVPSPSFLAHFALASSSMFVASLSALLERSPPFCLVISSILLLILVMLVLPAKSILLPSMP